MPGKLGEDSRLDPIFRIGAAEQILGVERLAARMRDEVFVEELEVGLAELAVAVPPDRVLGLRIDDRMLVLRAAAGMDAGLRADRSALNDGGFAIPDGVLVKLRRVEIPVDRREILETKLVSAVSAVPRTRFLHGKTSTDARPPPA